jgi:hypothetical protein
MVGLHHRRKPTLGDRVIENTPMLIMWGLGALIMSYLGWLASLTYLMFCFFSIFWFMRFICTFCVNSKNKICDSGLGNVAYSLFGANSPQKFRKQFMRNIAIQFPIWFVPPILAIWVLLNVFSYSMLFLLIFFCIVSFVILPLSSKKKTCDDCAMRFKCPWYKGEHKTSHAKTGRSKKGRNASSEE